MIQSQAFISITKLEDGRIVIRSTGDDDLSSLADAIIVTAASNCELTEVKPDKFHIEREYLESMLECHSRDK